MSQPRVNRRAVLSLFLGGTALVLAACGRRGAPLPPYDVDPCYPRHYPMDETQRQLCAKKEEDAREHPPQPQQPKQRGQKPPAAAPASPPANTNEPATTPSGQTPAPAPQNQMQQ